MSRPMSEVAIRKALRQRREALSRVRKLEPFTWVRCWYGPGDLHPTYCMCGGEARLRREDAIEHLEGECEALCK